MIEFFKLIFPILKILITPFLLATIFIGIPLVIWFFSLYLLYTKTVFRDIPWEGFKMMLLFFVSSRSFGTSICAIKAVIKQFSQ